MTSLPSEEWERLRALLASGDPACHEQGIELLIALADPWLYDQALADLRLDPAPSLRAQVREWERHLPDLPLATLRTRQRLGRSSFNASYRHEQAALRLAAAAPPGAGGDAPLRRARALQLGQGNLERKAINLAGLRAFSAVEWLDLAWTKALTGVEAMDELPALSCLSLASCEDLSFLEDLRLPSLERLLVSNSDPLPLGAWAARLERLVIADRQALDLAPLAGCPALRVLEVIAPAIRSPGALAGLARLEDLQLHAAGETEGWDFLRHLPTLRRLSLADERGLPAAIGALERLEELEFAAVLHQSPVNLRILEDLPSLRRLALDNLDYLPLFELDRALPQVEEIRLGVVHLRDRNARYWSFLDSLPGVCRVVLRGWQDDAPALWERLARLPRLESIELDRCLPGFRLPDALAERAPRLAG